MAGTMVKTARGVRKAWSRPRNESEQLGLQDDTCGVIHSAKEHVGKEEEFRHNLWSSWIAEVRLRGPTKLLLYDQTT